MVIAAGPIGRDPAQRLARQELAKAIYHPHESFIQWLEDQLDKLFNNASVSVHGGWWALVALTGLAVIVVAVAIRQIGPLARSRARRSPGPLHATVAMTAQQHRDLAERYAADGDYAGAIGEYLRAIATGLEERAVLAPSPGRTAAELAAEAGRLLPGQADELTAAARLFDEVCYGGRSGTRDGAERLRALDGAIRTARATVDDRSATRPAHAVPLPS
jgi:hypothetical protein